MKLLSLKKQLELIFSKATLKAFYFHKPVIFEVSKSTEYQTRISHDIYNSYREKQFKGIEDSVSAVSIANQIRDLIDQPNKQFDVWVDAFGSIQVRAKDSLLETYINNILSQNKFSPLMTQTFQKSNITNSLTTHKVIFPIVDILQQISLVHYRHWTHLQSLARMRQYFNDKVKRVSVVSNNLPFHGIVFKYMKQNPGQPATMQNLAVYLQSKQIINEQNILLSGTEMLSNLQNDDEMYQVYQQITKQKFIQLSEVFDFGKTQRLKSRQLNKQMPLEIILQLSKGENVTNHISCQRHELLQLEQIRSKHKLNLQIHRIGQINEGEKPIKALLNEVDAAIQNRLTQNIPQFAGKVEKSQRQWINYPISIISPQKYLSILPKQVSDFMFASFVQMISIHDRIGKLTPTEFKINNQSDRIVALLAIDVINHLDKNDIAGAHTVIHKLSDLVRSKPTYAGNKLLYLLVQSIYDLSCLM